MQSILELHYSQGYIQLLKHFVNIVQNKQLKHRENQNHLFQKAIQHEY